MTEHVNTYQDNLALIDQALKELNALDFDLAWMLTQMVYQSNVPDSIDGARVLAAHLALTVEDVQRRQAESESAYEMSLRGLEHGPQF